MMKKNAERTLKKIRLLWKDLIKVRRSHTHTNPKNKKERTLRLGVDKQL